MASGFDSIDSQTLAVAIQIYLDDVNDFKTHRKGKNRQDDISDEDVAVEAWQAELQAFSQLATDRVLCESIARAVGQDADLIEVSVQEDIQAAEDRNTALRMSGQGAATGPPRSSTPALPDLDEELEVKLRELNLPLSAKYDSQTTTAEPSSADATRKPGECRPQCCDSGPTRPSPQVACIACSDAFAQEKTWHVPCGHDYCHGCIKTLVTASIADESLFPPRCCNQALPLLDPSSAGFEFLPAKLRLQLISKKDEFETVDRTYCHIATCSTFLSTKADIRSDIGDCPACHALTCAICKGAAHDGGCPKDTASQEVLRIARENGWQQCHGCKRLVELDTGCNHMSMSSFFYIYIFSPLLAPLCSPNSLHLWRTVLLRLRYAVAELFLPAMERRASVCACCNRCRPEQKCECG